MCSFSLYNVMYQQFWSLNCEHQEIFPPQRQPYWVLLLNSAIQFNNWPAVVSAHHPWELSLAVQTVINFRVPLPPLLCTKLLLELQSIRLLPQSILISAVTQLKERKTDRSCHSVGLLLTNLNWNAGESFTVKISLFLTFWEAFRHKERSKNLLKLLQRQGEEHLPCRELHIISKQTGN